MRLHPQDKPLMRGAEVPYGEVGSLRNWFPVTLGGDPLSVGWRHLGDRRLTAAFFADSLVGQQPAERRVCTTPLSALASLRDAVLPTAFIFHVSRCGSTLLTQMLAGLPQCIVLSEPPVLDSFFRWRHHRPEHATAQVLRQLVWALGQRRSPAEQHCIIKLDSWHLPWMPWFREVFPDTPFVLLYRHPAEVLASHQRQRGPQMVPGLLDTSMLQPDATGLVPADLDGYGARVLDALFESASRVAQQLHAGGGLTLVNYSELPSLLWTDLTKQWGMPCDSVTLEVMQRRAQFHSKQGAQEYQGDPIPHGTGLPGSATDCETTAWRCYTMLETLREGQLREGKMPCKAMM